MMKYVKWRILIITCLVCLLPILFGLALWDKLPETIAIHFNFNNEPDNFASKGFVVFALPVLMAAFQIFCCTVTDINANKKGESPKFETAVKWIIPAITVILHIVTLGYALGWNIDIRRVAVIIVGAVFVVTGNYMPKLDYIKNRDVDRETAKKINRAMGIEIFIMGLLFVISAFLPPIASLICLLLLIPFAFVNIILAIKAEKKK